MMRQGDMNMSPLYHSMGQAGLQGLAVDLSVYEAHHGQGGNRLYADDQRETRETALLLQRVSARGTGFRSWQQVLSPTRIGFCRWNASYVMLGWTSASMLLLLVHLQPRPTVYQRVRGGRACFISLVDQTLHRMAASRYSGSAHSTSRWY
jgi:hypothetical protein